MNTHVWERRARGGMSELPTSKRVLLHVRYTFGYLAASFVISVPIEVYGTEGAMKAILSSLLYGGVCGLVFVALIPLTDVDWEGMRLPAFKRFELDVTRNTLIASVAILILANLQALPPLMPRTAWFVFILSAFAYLKIKGHSVLFHEFYRAGLGEAPEPSLPRDIEQAVKERLAGEPKGDKAEAPVPVPDAHAATPPETRGTT